MDVRGPKRAAGRRLIQGVLTVCAIGTVCAPAASASTLTSILGTNAPPGTTAAYTAAAGESNSLTLKISTDPTLGNLVLFSDVPAISVPEPDVGALEVQDCVADPTSATSANCPGGPGTKLAIDLGTGNDTLKLSDGLPPVDIDGGTGSDRLDFGLMGAGVTVNLSAADAAPGVTARSIEGINGSPGADTLTASTAGSRLNGMDGEDTLTGDDGDDTLNGGNGIDHLNGGAGINKLNGGPGDDFLTAGNEGDALNGGDGSDTITGGNGDDVIVAADSFTDTVTCGLGSDTVVTDLRPTAVPDKIAGDCENVTSVANPDAGTVTETTLTPVIVVPGSKVPGLATVLAPGKADFADLTPPKASMRSFTRQRLATVLKRGVPIRVTCQEACGISIALSLDRTTARRLKLDARTSPVVVGTASAVRNLAGSSRLHVKFTKKARAALKRSRRNVVATAQVLVSDASGNGMLLTRRVTLVR
jgi:Ca2+-binding RTX toxin-like protein